LRRRHSWNQQEQPNLRQGLATHQQRRAEAAGRIHADSGDVDAEDVDCHEGNMPMARPAKPVGALSCIDPRMTMTKISVATNSKTMAEVML